MRKNIRGKWMAGIILLTVSLAGCGKEEKESILKVEIQADEEMPEKENAPNKVGMPEAEKIPKEAAAEDREGTETQEEAEEASDTAKNIEVDYATMNNNVGGRELPIYCVETQENKIALSFDAAWGNDDTGKILDILKEHDIRVTFFMTGGWVESYPDDVKAILAAEHDLGNHSENHKNMSQISDDEKKEELMKVHQKVKDITGYDMFLFRPPYGDYDNAVIDTAKDCGYYAIQWDVDSLDWTDQDAASIIKTVTEHKNLGNGSIILCHNGAKYTPEALEEMITVLEEKGYEFVPISELIYRDHYHMNYEGRQIAD